MRVEPEIRSCIFLIVDEGKFPRLNEIRKAWREHIDNLVKDASGSGQK